MHAICGNTAEPFRDVGLHLVHVLFTGAEHNVLAVRFCDMLGEYFIQPVRLLQRPSQGI